MTKAGEAALLIRQPATAIRPLTVAEYHRMGEVGILDQQERVELIEGQILAMAPFGSDHAGRVNRLTRLLINAVGANGVIAPQNPVRLSDITEPQPDFAILKPRADDYTSAIPVSDDVLLLIEVANSSLSYDRGLKRALYARHGIPAFWIVNLADSVIEVHRDPTGDAYTTVFRAAPGAVLDITRLPNTTLSVSAVFD